MSRELRGIETEPPPSEYEEKAPWMAPAAAGGGPEGANRNLNRAHRRWAMVPLLMFATEGFNSPRWQSYFVIIRNLLVMLFLIS